MTGSSRFLVPTPSPQSHLLFLNLSTRLGRRGRCSTGRQLSSAPSPSKLLWGEPGAGRDGLVREGTQTQHQLCLWVLPALSLSPKNQGGGGKEVGLGEGTHQPHLGPADSATLTPQIWLHGPQPCMRSRGAASIPRTCLPFRSPRPINAGGQPFPPPHPMASAAQPRSWPRPQPSPHAPSPPQSQR